ncbi:F-box associated ubiquitination effector family protein [Citrus sinensis]|nr:F-box associated ubiquitination effector family protein [Citrus sinensis]
MVHQSIGTDILSEILSRATLQTVGRCRLASKECNDLTYRSYFMHLHCQRTRTISGFLLASMMSHKHPAEFVSTDNNIPNIVSLRFLPGCARILACTNQGLLLCLNSRPKCHRIPEYYVCKPTTKEWQQIPNPKTRYFARNVAMMVLRLDPLRYKIIRLSEPSHLRNLNRKHAYEHCFCCEVFDSERWAWRQLEEMYLPYDEVLTSKPAISACGAFHWLTSEKNILAFNADDETWTMLSVPDAVNNKSYYLQLAGYQGKLACLRKERGREDCFELWVMEDYFGKKLWNKKHTVSTKPLQIEERFVSPEALYNAENALKVVSEPLVAFVESDTVHVYGLKSVNLPFCEHCITSKQYRLKFSRKYWVYPIKKNSDVFLVFKEYKARVELEFGKTIKCLRTDNGGKYTDNESLTYYRKEEAARTAYYVVNRSSSTTIRLKTPIEMWTGKPTDYCYLHAFGCPVAHKIVISRDVIFVKYQLQRKDGDDSTIKEKSETVLVYVENNLEKEDSDSSEAAPELEKQELVESEAIEVRRLTRERPPLV